jgi:hypothetical protein
VYNPLSKISFFKVSTAKVERRLTMSDPENNLEPAALDIQAHAKAVALAEKFLAVVEAEEDPMFDDIFSALAFSLIGFMGDAAVAEGNTSEEYLYDFVERFNEFMKKLVPKTSFNLTAFAEGSKDGE